MLYVFILILGCVIGFFIAGIFHSSADSDRRDELYYSGYEAGYQEAINQFSIK